MDVYKEACRLAGMLDQSGHEAYAVMVVDAIETGSTGTEIMMTLRQALRVLPTSALTPELHGLRDALMAVIGKSLE